MFRDIRLSRGQLILWMISIIVCVFAFTVVGGGDLLTLTASLIGVTALIYVAKGHALGQLLTIVFAVFYGVISFAFRYYGEMITYLGMTAPSAALALITWLKHPYKQTAEVEVGRLGRRKLICMALSTAAVVIFFWCVLGALGNARLGISTLSVATSYIASYLTICRSPLYALAYAANDLVLIILWVLAAGEDPTAGPMIACFSAFFANDMYGYINWSAMCKRQAKEKQPA